MPELGEREWWTVGAVADLLGVHRVSVHRIPRDELGYVEHGRRKVRRYSPADVRAYADARAVTTGGVPGVLAMVVDHERRLVAVEEQLGGAT